MATASIHTARPMQRTTRIAKLSVAPRGIEVRRGGLSIPLEGGEDSLTLSLNNAEAIGLALKITTHFARAGRSANHRVTRPCVASFGSGPEAA